MEKMEEPLLAAQLIVYLSLYCKMLLKTTMLSALGFAHFRVVQQLFNGRSPTYTFDQASDVRKKGKSVSKRSRPVKSW